MIDSRGVYMWYYVSPEALLDVDVFNKLIKEHQALVGHMRPPKTGHIFRRACEEYSKDAESPFTIKDQGYHADQIVRTIMFGNTSVGTLILTKGSFELFVRTDDVTSRMIAQSVMQHIKNRMTELDNKMHDLPLRESLRKTIEGPLYGIPMKPSGGVYFIPSGYQDKVNNLVAMYQEVPGAILATVPVPATDEQDDLLSEALERAYRPRLADLANRVAQMGSDDEGGATPLAKVFLDMEAELCDTACQVAEYSFLPAITDGMISEIQNIKENLTNYMKE